MGQAMFKRIQFVCCYFGCKASRAQAVRECSPPLLLHVTPVLGYMTPLWPLWAWQHMVHLFSLTHTHAHTHIHTHTYKQTNT